MDRPRGSQYAELTDLPCSHRERMVVCPCFVSRSLSTATLSTRFGAPSMLLGPLLLLLEGERGDAEPTELGAERSVRPLRVSSIRVSQTLR